MFLWRNAKNYPWNYRQIPTLSVLLHALTFLSFHFKNVSNVTFVVLEPSAARWNRKKNTSNLMGTMWWENLPADICEQERFQLVCSATEASWNLRIFYIESVSIILSDGTYTLADLHLCGSEPWNHISLRNHSHMASAGFAMTWLIWKRACSADETS